MEKHIDEVMSSGDDTKQLAIQHMRQPCYRVPVGSVARAKRPRKAFPGKPCLNVWVLRYIKRIIVIEKTVCANLPVDAEQDDNQYQT